VSASFGELWAMMRLMRVTLKRTLFFIECLKCDV